MYFLRFPETKRLFEIFDKNHLEARFVGGCVRDGLCGLQTDDFDVAINCEINKLCNILGNAGLRVIKTGIKFSSITVIINNRQYQITSLREDFSCDGRHCVVGATADFKQDAKRRDFTINALYIDQYGNLFDYFGGQKDLKNHVVRFIGNPETRIQEDYLRIFRYYRFCAKYGDFSNRYRDIIKSLSNNISKLSIERIQAEIIKLLQCQNNYKILEFMTESVLECNLKNYKKLLDVYPGARTVLKLYILFDKDTLFHKLRLPKKYTTVMKQYIKYEREPLLYVAYKTSEDVQQDIVILQYILHNKPMQNLITRDFPPFPIKYQDVCEVIPRSGKLLKICERWWVLNNFAPTKRACIEYLNKLQA